MLEALHRLRSLIAESNRIQEVGIREVTSSWMSPIGLNRNVLCDLIIKQ
jgi:hypothetical protein